ncbi:MAG: hypothetical protein LBM75_00655 [Myxococcales bacterium]|nr:hypothetical protein [Myxococcales bacterium]
MIRLVTIEELPPAQTARLCACLYQAYGIGCEPSPADLLPRLPAKGPIDAVAFLEQADCAEALDDDKVVFVTSRPLAARDLPSGKVPTQSMALVPQGRAIVTTHGLPNGDPDRFLKRLAKLAVHEVGRLWGLHHCLDVRCALYPPWSPPFTTAEQPQLCAFCRDKSDEKIRMAKS